MCEKTPVYVFSMMESNQSPNTSLQQQLQGQAQQGNNNLDNGSNDSFPMQCIRFSPFQQQNWHSLCDQSLQELYEPFALMISIPTMTILLI